MKCAHESHVRCEGAELDLGRGVRLAELEEELAQETFRKQRERVGI